MQQAWLCTPRCKSSLWSLRFCTWNLHHSLSQLDGPTLVRFISAGAAPVLYTQVPYNAADAIIRRLTPQEVLGYVSNFLLRPPDACSGQRGFRQCKCLGEGNVESFQGSAPDVDCGCGALQEYHIP